MLLGNGHFRWSHEFSLRCQTGVRLKRKATDCSKRNVTGAIPEPKRLALRACGNAVPGATTQLQHETKDVCILLARPSVRANRSGSRTQRIQLLVCDCPPCHNLFSLFPFENFLFASMMQRLNLCSLPVKLVVSLLDTGSLSVFSRGFHYVSSSSFAVRSC